MPDQPVSTARKKIDFLVCFAVKEEAKHLRIPSTTRAILTGMGRENAEFALGNALEEYVPKMVLTCGFAGGLNPALEINQIVFEAGENLALQEKLIELGGKQANFFCARRIASTSVEKERLWRATGMDVIEMESEAIREMCRERGIPSATIRVISDSALDDLPLDFNKLMSSSQNIDYKKLTWALVRKPTKLVELLAFQQKTIEASKALSAYLEKLLLSRAGV